MSLASADIPSDVEALRAFALACQAELRSARCAVQRNGLEIERLKMQIAKLRRQQFGQSSERLASQGLGARIGQLELQLEELEMGEAEDLAQAIPGDAEPVATPDRVGPKARRKPLPDHLPREIVVHEPIGIATLEHGDHTAAAGCGACGGRLAKLGEDVTEVLDYVPGQFRVIRHVRPKYACSTCDDIMQAPAAPMPTPRGRAAPRLLAHLLTAKYADHLPLYRQSEIYARQGVDLDRSTLADWVGQAVWLLDPVVEAIRGHVFKATKLHADDTPVPVLSPGLGRTRTGRLWVYVRDDRAHASTDPPAAAFFFSPDRKAEHPAQHLKGFKGALQADAYAGYQPLYKRQFDDARVIEVACWAHCRRKIFDVWKAKQSAVAQEGLDRIARIYRVEAAARGLPPPERVALRAASRPILDAFFIWAEAVSTKLSSKSALAEALTYALKRRAALSRFLDDGRLEVDNNIAENALRAVALGRKNYLFAGSDLGGERAAALYTLVQTAKLNAVDPESYLNAVLDKITNGHPISRITQLLPWAIKSP